MAAVYPIMRVTFRDVAGVESTIDLKVNGPADYDTELSVLTSGVEAAFAALIVMSEAKAVKTEIIFDVSAETEFIDGEIPGEFCNVSDHAFVRITDAGANKEFFRIPAPDMSRYDHLPNQVIKGLPNWDADIDALTDLLVSMDDNTALTHQYSQLRNRKRWVRQE